MMTFGFLNENVSFHFFSQETPLLFFAAFEDTAIEQ